MPKAVTLRKVDGKPGQVYYPLELQDVSTPTPGPDELLVRMSAAALNHRDLFIRQHLYPGVTFGVPLLADGAGTVVSTGSSALDSQWLNKRVVLTPGRGWASFPDGPEDAAGYAILGGTKSCSLGTLQELVVVHSSEVEETPPHLSWSEAAALPLTGLTAWRALRTKSGNCKAGNNILVTGIGGGVAQSCLQLAAASGCNVFVTSGSEEKLHRAKEMGAQGGVIYSDKEWPKKLLAQLPTERKLLDAVIDGAGGDIIEKVVKIMKVGGVIVSYGMTLGPVLPFPMSAVMKNIEVRGSTMGSREEFASMISYVRTKEIHPVISRSVRGLEDLESLDNLFDDMKAGTQFGKLVVLFDVDEQEGKSRL
ncbi:MAG: hypothetical protein M1825_000902 [Sarcosagium campestre]|nr:MAG: hypothetical protein M1825_000902 [Sarcosagium campestre]